MNDVELFTRLCARAPYINDIACGRYKVVALGCDNMRQGADLVALDDDTTTQERRDRFIRNARNRFGQWRRAGLG